jgi:cobalt-zinc-cadmium efflux system protein
MHSPDDGNGHSHGKDHDHQHDHGHPHGHVHAPADFGRAFAIGTLLNGGFVAAEAAFGLWGHSLALLADAGHNLSDVLGLLIAWWASRLARRPPTRKYTYAFGSASILAALANAVLLLVVTGGIAWEAIDRLRAPEAVASGTVVIVAAIGVAINLGTALMFMAGRRGDLNVRAAFLHMMGDAAISAGVVVAGWVIGVTGWLWLDPAVSLAVSALIVAGTWGVLRHATEMAMQAVPAGIDPHEVQRCLAAVHGVREVHDLHVWAMSTTETALSAHLVFPDGHPGDDRLGEIVHELEHRFGIRHSTLQVELGNGASPCRLAPADIV